MNEHHVPPALAAARREGDERRAMIQKMADEHGCDVSDLTRVMADKRTREALEDIAARAAETQRMVAEAQANLIDRIADLAAAKVVSMLVAATKVPAESGEPDKQ
jgi:hypothetical protein